MLPKEHPIRKLTKAAVQPTTSPQSRHPTTMLLSWSPARVAPRPRSSYDDERNLLGQMIEFNNFRVC